MRTVQQIDDVVSDATSTNILGANSYSLERSMAPLDPTLAIFPPSDSTCAMYMGVGEINGTASEPTVITVSRGSSAAGGPVGPRVGIISVLSSCARIRHTDLHASTGDFLVGLASFTDSLWVQHVRITGCQTGFYSKDAYLSVQDSSMTHNSGTAFLTEALLTRLDRSNFSDNGVHGVVLAPMRRTAFTKQGHVYKDVKVFDWGRYATRMPAHQTDGCRVERNGGNGITYYFQYLWDMMAVPPAVSYSNAGERLYCLHPAYGFPDVLNISMLTHFIARIGMNESALPTLVSHNGRFGVSAHRLGVVAGNVRSTNNRHGIVVSEYSLLSVIGALRAAPTVVSGNTVSGFVTYSHAIVGNCHAGTDHTNAPLGNKGGGILILNVQDQSFSNVARFDTHMRFIHSVFHGRQTTALAPNPDPPEESKGYAEGIKFGSAQWFAPADCNGSLCMQPNSTVGISSALQPIARHNDDTGLVIAK